MDNNDYINIYVYRIDNYELIQTIYNAHDGIIKGFADINNRFFVSYSSDRYIKIRSF